MTNDTNVKPEGGASGEQVVLRVRDQTGEEIQFKVCVCVCVFVMREGEREG
jgi:hypothetical protein